MHITFICYLLPLVDQVTQSCVLTTIEVLQKCTNGSQFSTIKHIVWCFYPFLHPPNKVNENTPKRNNLNST